MKKMRVLIMILALGLINCRTIQLGQKMMDQALAIKHNQRQKMTNKAQQYFNLMPLLAEKLNKMDLHKMLNQINPK